LFNYFKYIHKTTSKPLGYSNLSQNRHNTVFTR